MALSRDEVRRVAFPAHIDLIRDECDAQAVPLNRFAEQIGALLQIDVTGSHLISYAIPGGNILHEDVMRPLLSRDVVLAIVPGSSDGCFVVPPVLGGR